MSGPHRFNPTVLREYDVRGVVGETLSKDDAYALGRSFGTVVRRNNGKTACVGYDGRLTSPELEAAVVRGLADCGIEVWRVGLGPTPMPWLTLHAGSPPRPSRYAKERRPGPPSTGLLQPTPGGRGKG